MLESENGAVALVESLLQVYVRQIQSVFIPL